MFAANAPMHPGRDAAGLVAAHRLHPVAACALGPVESQVGRFHPRAQALLRRDGLCIVGQGLQQRLRTLVVTLEHPAPYLPALAATGGQGADIAGDPGIGYLLYNALRSSDYFLIQGVAFSSNDIGPFARFQGAQILTAG